MSHEVESMAYVNAVPWHGIGEQITDPAIAVDPDRFRIAAGLDWHVERVPVFARFHVGLGQSEEDYYYEETTHFATVRTSDQAILGVVGPRYRVLQNHELFDWFRPFLESGMATLETGGSLKNGSVIWALAKIASLQSLVAPDDLVEAFVLLSHAHDGTQAIRVGFTPIRVVCHNTLSASFRAADSKLIRVRHTESLHDNLDAIRETMDLATQEFRATSEQYRRLAESAINQGDIERYVNVVMGFEAEVDDDDMTTRARNQRDQIVELAQSGIGNSGETWWDAYNGVTEYLNYFDGRSQDSRLRSLWFGQNQQAGQKAFEVALEMSGVVA